MTEFESGSLDPLDGGYGGLLVDPNSIMVPASGIPELVTAGYRSRVPDPAVLALPTPAFGTSRLTKNGSKASFPDPVISGKGNGVSGLPTSTIYRRSDRASQVSSACQAILDLILLRVHLVSTALAWRSSVPNSGEGGLTGFDFPKFWVPDLDIHSVPTPSPTTLTEFRMRLIICFEVPAQDSGDVPTSDDSSDLHGFVQPGVVPFRSVIEVCPIYADLPISGDKPLCARDDEAKGWSTAGFWAIMLIHFQHGEQLCLTLDEALVSVVTVDLFLASGGNRLLISVQLGQGGRIRATTR